MNKEKIQDFLKRKGIEDIVVNYDMNNEPFTPSYIVEEWEKEQLLIQRVSNRRELLTAFLKYGKQRHYTPLTEEQIEFLVNDFEGSL